MTLVLQAIGIVLFVALVFITVLVCFLIAAGKFFNWIDHREPLDYAPPLASTRVCDEPVYLRKWTAGRKLDAHREQEQWQKLFDSSLR